MSEVAWSCFYSTCGKGWRNEGMNDVQKLTKNQIHQIRAKRKCSNIRVKFPLITIFDNFKRKSSQEEIVMLDQTYRSWEKIKWSPKMNSLDDWINSLQQYHKNLWRTVWRRCMLEHIAGLSYLGTFISTRLYQITDALLGLRGNNRPEICAWLMA